MAVQEPGESDELVCGISRQKFIVFCSELEIPAKEGSEGGQILVPMELIPTQVYLLDEIMAGLRDGIHDFKVLKCRQSGTTTLGLAFELWWSFMHPGFIMHFIADTAKRLAYNRSLVIDMLDSVSSKPEWCIPIKEGGNNKEMLEFTNRSKIIWNNANTRDEGGMGRGVGAMGVHATEVPRYKDEDGISALEDGLPKRNKNRFFLWEGTSEGPNHFKDICDEAASPTNTSQKFIFIGWWLHPDYEADLKTEEGKKIFNTYWKGCPRLDRDEAAWIQGVRDRYSFEIRPTQLAWWRYWLKEHKRGNREFMHQEYPPLAEYAWMYGGYSYVSGTSVSVQSVNTKRAADKARYFQFVFGADFESTHIIEVDPAQTWHDLVCFEEPRQSPFMRYAIGLDPAHGANEQSDNASIVGLACYADQCVQVFEWQDKERPSYQLAWVLLYLAGAYNSQTMINIELQGGGYGVFDEIEKLQQQLTSGYNDALGPYFSGLRHYMDARADSVSKVSNTYHWITSGKKLEQMLTYWRDLFERGLVEVRSQELVKQTANVRRDRTTGELEPPKEDHLLTAACVASMAYRQIIETDIGGMKEFYRDKVEQKINPEAFTTGATEEKLLRLNVLNWYDRLLLNIKTEEEDKRANVPDWITDMQTVLKGGNQ